MREEQVLSSVSWVTRRNLDEYYLGFRWMDDAVHIVDEGAPLGVLKVIRRLTRRATYGEGLNLLRTHTSNGRPTAFGFRWDIGGGQIHVEQDLSWVPDFLPLRGLSKPYLFYEGAQLDTRKTREGILLGYFLRMAHCSNMEEGIMITRLMRASFEMIRTGHDPNTIRKTLNKTAGQLKCSVREVIHALDWTRGEQDVFNLCHDLAYRLW